MGGAASEKGVIQRDSKAFCIDVSFVQGMEGSFLASHLVCESKPIHTRGVSKKASQRIQSQREEALDEHKAYCVWNPTGNPEASGVSSLT